MTLSRPWWCETDRQYEDWKADVAQKRDAAHRLAVQDGWMFRADAIDFGPPDGFVLGGLDERQLARGIMAVLLVPDHNP